jgi:hypothetical protein
MSSKTIEEEAKEGAPTTCILCKPLGNRSIQRKQHITTTLHQLFHEDNKNALGTCMVPSSAANALPTLPAMMMAVTTGESSLARARDNTPPTDLVSPSLANSRTNCKAKPPECSAIIEYLYFFIARWMQLPGIKISCFALRLDPGKDLVS